ncbi:hypothetical protein Y032_0317g2306 [Ancylostoma ceylanicum]|uniref:Phlebovirus glycoprotein G2 fusion domain-containing protein n=1 Tax=Ancylostoma ceylanicum TaxID=53326 RepID=A0A016S153_9BILA|nr:hypothetical protein Y032_0317g2306 [Ancylostoma ceylanicum]
MPSTETVHELRRYKQFVVPVEYESIHLLRNYVVATTDEGEFVVVVESKKTAGVPDIAEVVTKEYCDIQTQVIGCYECAHEAMVMTSSKSKMPTEATIACENHEFAIKCGPTNATTTILLAFNHAIVEERCKTDFSGTSEYVVLYGTLHYHVEKPNGASTPSLRRWRRHSGKLRARQMLSLSDKIPPWPFIAARRWATSPAYP